MLYSSQKHFQKHPLGFFSESALWIKLVYCMSTSLIITFFLKTLYLHHSNLIYQTFIWHSSELITISHSLKAPSNISLCLFGNLSHSDLSAWIALQKVYSTNCYALIKEDTLKSTSQKTSSPLRLCTFIILFFPHGCLWMCWSSDWIDLFLCIPSSSMCLLSKLDRCFLERHLCHSVWRC